MPESIGRLLKLVYCHYRIFWSTVARRVLANVSVLLPLAVLVALYALILLGRHEMFLGVQVHYLFENGVTVNNWYAPRPAGVLDSAGNILVVTETHRLRYFLTYPLFFITQNTGLTANRVFTLVSPVLAAAILALVADTVRIFVGRPVPARSVVAIVPLALLLFFMDGRLILAFFGFTVILRLLMSQRIIFTALKLLVLSIGLLFSSVSSGTFVLCIVCVFVLCSLSASHARATFESVISFTPFIYVFAVFHYDIYSIFEKNMSYYGGGLQGLIGMFGHGAGRAVLHMAQKPAFLGTLVLGCLLVAVMALRFLVSARDKRLPAVTGVALAIGLFGYSALALVIIPATIWVSVFVAREV